MLYQLNADQLVEPRESTYFTVAAVISILVWLICIVTVVPIFYILLFGFFIWLGNGLLVAQLKSEAVQVDQDQMPGLMETFRSACAKLQMTEIPELYILQSGGFLNAFATRFCGRNFVVVYSELLETYGPTSAEIEFLLGHELGHIKRNHIMKYLFLAPGRLVPLLGNAYSRACESTCDRHGAFVARDMQGAVNAMMVLAGGKQATTLMNPNAMAAQYQNNRGFFVSWYELVSGYPTLSHRVSNLLAFKNGQEPVRAGRNPLAYFFALFSIGGRGSAGSNIIITIALIAFLAAILMPAVSKARQKGLETQALYQKQMMHGNDEEMQWSQPESEGE
jgi:Zn-dependent protease with chaperone function